MRSRHVLTSVSVATLIWSVPALAGIDIWVHATRAQPYQVFDTDPHAIPLDDAGRTTLHFNFGVDFKYHKIVSYSANCVVQGTGGYVAITILVDNKPAKPSGAGDVVLCSETPASGVPISATRISFAATKKRPSHNIQIIAKGVNTTSWQLSNSFLLVEF